MKSNHEPVGATGGRLEVAMAAHLDAVRRTVTSSSEVIAGIVERLSDCFERDGKLLICGNGGARPMPSTWPPSS